MSPDAMLAGMFTTAEVLAVTPLVTAVVWIAGKANGLTHRELHLGDGVVILVEDLRGIRAGRRVGRSKLDSPCS
jgi:hypothetical protein